MAASNKMLGDLLTKSTRQEQLNTVINYLMLLLRIQYLFLLLMEDEMPFPAFSGWCDV